MEMSPDYIMMLFSTSLLYGIYLILVVCAICILCRKEGNLKARIVLSTAVIAMFSISTWFVVTTAILAFAQARTATMDVVRDNGFLFQVTVISTPLLFLYVLIGDFLVVWRANVLWTGNTKIILIPSVLLLGSTGVTCTFVGCALSQHSDLDSSCNAVNIAAFALSFITNITATAAIGYEAWVHRKAMKAYAEALNNKQTLVQKVLTLLLESGIAYSILFVTGMIAFIPSQQATPLHSRFLDLIEGFGFQVIGIYPTAVIVLVYLQKSFWDPHGHSLSSPTNSTSPHRRTLGNAEMPEILLVSVQNTYVDRDGTPKVNDQHK